MNLNQYKNNNNLNISYNGKLLSYSETATKEEIASKPVVNFQKNSNKLYTVIMVDPDAPSPKNPINRYFLHWLVVNISSNFEGETINEYTAPNPPEGKHRYYTCILEQENEITRMKEFERVKFDISKFVSNNNLQLIACTKFVVNA